MNREGSEISPKRNFYTTQKGLPIKSPTHSSYVREKKTVQLYCSTFEKDRMNLLQRAILERFNKRKESKAKYKTLQKQAFTLMSLQKKKFQKSGVTL
jgi:hypothetical protein